MEKLIIARHGDYDSQNGLLRPFGEFQMKRLAEYIKPIVGSSRVIVLASDAPRGSGSGDIMAKVLGCLMERHIELFSNPAHDPDKPKALELLQSKAGDYDVVIVVTHLEYVQVLPPYIGRHVFGGVVFDHGWLPNGSAWLIDFTTKTCVEIPPETK